MGTNVREFAKKSQNLQKVIAVKINFAKINLKLLIVLLTFDLTHNLSPFFFITFLMLNIV